MAARTMLTHQQREFVINYLRCWNGTDAAMSAYNVKNRNTAAVIASENLRKHNIVVTINALSPRGYILEKSVQAISDGLEATKGVNKLPDHRIQLKAAAMGIKLLDEIYK